MGEYRIQKGVQHGGVPQHAGAFALGGHGAGGAAEVQIHFGVTQGTQLTDHPGSQLAVLGQQLRDHRRTGSSSAIFFLMSTRFSGGERKGA